MRLSTVVDIVCMLRSTYAETGSVSRFMNGVVGRYCVKRRTLGLPPVYFNVSTHVSDRRLYNSVKSITLRNREHSCMCGLFHEIAQKTTYNIYEIFPVVIFPKYQILLNREIRWSTVIRQDMVTCCSV